MYSKIASAHLVDLVKYKTVNLHFWLIIQSCLPVPVQFKIVGNANRNLKLFFNYPGAKRIIHGPKALDAINFIRFPLAV